MTDLTSSTAGLASSGLGRLQSMQSLIWRTSVALGTESPEKVSSNFINMLKSAGPVLSDITTLIVPWAMLITVFYRLIKAVRINLLAPADVSRYDWLCRAVASMKDYVMSFMHASISIPGDHALNQQVLRWVLNEGAKSQIRTLALLNHVNNSPWALNGMMALGMPPVHFPGMAAVTEENNDARRTMMPREPSRTFRTSAAIRSTSVAIEWCSSQETALVISCFSVSGTQPIKALLAHIEADAALARENKTSIYRPTSDQNGWDSGLPRAARPLDAVTLQAGVKKALIQDIESYLHPKTKKYYGARGIPWRRGYLFYGPPGTGKSSLAIVLAGHFRLNIYMISLSSRLLNDSRLDALFDMLPQKCIVLLEDIDSAGIRREDMSGEIKEKKKKRVPMANSFGFRVSEESEGVTLSGLLNVLDGVRAAEGRIVIISSNHPNTLDEALIRRGRIDQRFHFGRASKDVAAKLFMQVFLKSKEELLDDELPQNEATVVYMAGQFAQQLAEYTFTPAEVQGYLIDHRADAAKAVREAKVHFEEVQATKTTGFDMMDGKDKASARPAEVAFTDLKHVEKTSPSTPESSESMVVVDEEAQDRQS
ncbi:hypothetical protein LTR10_011956 [Elasticomyces elasticus]|nr:hypothetical protein LTR10_011956 [Elasticomyces elasticus]KAK4968897.1 hypothetical protein LTR42_009176 [Elasticomyces elasticus]